ncbi:energy transducer TonB [Pseudogulbenkiania ferrooxidans]|uniref:TonB family protein n=1 Tax=Pseudogulbenkiania ferrooxidans 2002 TaxID=279714 RepID=B9Z625_9NEIS|nr:energy transducer TonB [Pseudogulbenkiania ferrooxidans]EEG08022.1 TonB family protein [Pseudogulbenkiania ferrooxidans 2002]
MPRNLRHPPSPPASSWLFTVTLAVSVLVHVLLFAAGHITWIRPIPLPETSTISVKLAQAPQKTPPPTLRLAEQNTVGAGNTPAPGKLASHVPERITPGTAGPARHQQEAVVAAPHPPAANERLTAPTNDKQAPVRTPAPSSPPSPPITAQALLAQASVVARQQGDDDTVNRPDESGRTKGVYGITARGVEWARYVDDWRLKVERIGNLNYPDEARRQQIFGSLELTVVVNADGTLRSVTVRRSSGHDVLDNAAKNIVRLSAPFAPFPPSLAEKYSALEIVRRWAFTQDSRLASP